MRHVLNRKAGRQAPPRHQLGATSTCTYLLLPPHNPHASLLPACVSQRSSRGTTSSSSAGSGGNLTAHSSILSSSPGQPQHFTSGYYPDERGHQLVPANRQPASPVSIDI